MGSGKKWNSDEICIIADNYGKIDSESLSALLPGRSKQAIYKRAYKMGLRVPPDIEFLNRSNAKRGAKSSNWNGGKRKTCKGYIQVLRPDHHRADSSGYVMQHIVVWEEKTGLIVPQNCVVHHLNGVKTDNRIENLCLMERGAHTVFHHSGRHLSAETKAKISKARRSKNAE